MSMPSPERLPFGFMLSVSEEVLEDDEVELEDVDEDEDESESESESIGCPWMLPAKASGEV